MKKRVLITNLVPQSAYLRLSKRYAVTYNKKRLTEAQLASKIRSYDAVLCTLADPLTAQVIHEGLKLKCIANYAVGFNNIDLKAAKECGVVVTNTPDVLTDATADLAWALILACARRVPEGERLVRSGQFKGGHALLLLGHDLKGKTLGIYGFGRIGKAVAARGKGWSMPVLYHQRHRESEVVEKRYNAHYVPFKTLLAQSDILSVNSPLTPETKHRFTRAEFKQMKSNSIFINTSRGLVHKEADIVKALKAGLIASAGLDVYEFEPRVNRELKKLPNCVLLPHIGSATVATREKMADLAVGNIERVLSGRKPLTPIKL